MVNCFDLKVLVSSLAIGLAVGLANDKAEFICGDVAVGLSG